MKKVSVIVLHYKNEEDTVECLESLNKLDTSNISLSAIVVDNGSEQKFKIQSLKFKVNIELLSSDKNLGFSGGNNIGIKKALTNGSEYIVILNNDTVVSPGLVQELIKVGEEDNAFGIIAPKIYFAKGSEFHNKRYKDEEQGRVIWYAGGNMDWENVIGSHRGVDEVDSGQYDKVSETDFASGCCMMVKSEVFKKIGLLDDKYFLYYEDADLSIRAKRRGFEIVFAPEATLWHKNAASAGGSGSELQDYFITRNRLLFGVRYAPTRAKLALFKESLKLMFYGRTWQKKGVVDFYLRRFGKGSFVLNNKL